MKGNKIHPIMKRELEEKEDPLRTYRNLTSADMRYRLVRHPGKKKNSLLIEALKARIAQENEEEQLILSRRKGKFQPRVESAPMDSLGTMGEVTTARTNENFLDVGGAEIEETTIGTTMQTDQGQREILSVAKYLSRPVEIYRTTVSPGSNVGLDIPVWDLFTLTPAVRAKLRNYAYLKADLRVRISVAGTPFHYGRLLASYQPFGEHNPTLQHLLDMVALETNFRPMLINYLSQAPGSAIININENKPLELHIPFISPKPMFRLFNKDTAAIGSSSSYDDLAHTGDVMLYSINPVSAVNATSTPIQIQVYAWMENVQLGTNTATQIAVTTESKPDERETGPIERMASNVSRFLSVGEYVPTLAPYAKASSMVADGVGKLAALMGWSQPVVDQEVNIVKWMPVSNGAQAIGRFSGFKMSWDPKQEVAVIPGVMGGDEDEMLFSSILSRPCYLTTFTWDDADEAMTDIIYTCVVNPMLTTSYEVANIRYYQPTPMAFIGALFKYWRGDIIFRFEVVCSSFHRGKLAVFFEPNHNQIDIINASLSMNKQFMRVIDIQETQVFEMRVNWASYREWLKMTSSTHAYLNTDSTSSQTYGPGYVNGYIGVVPFTSLQSPDSSAISVNVYVYSDSMHFNGTLEENLPDAREVYTESKLAGCIVSQEYSRFDLNPSSASLENISMDHFGEQVESFRTLLKRFVKFANPTMENTTLALPKYLKIIRTIFPDNNMVYTLPSFPIRDVFSYLRYAYLGMRGGMRVRYGVHHNVISYPFYWQLQLEPPDNDVTQSDVEATGYVSVPLEGTLQFATYPNGGGSAPEGELPFYTNNLFLFPPSSTYTFDTDLDVCEGVWFRKFSLAVQGNSTTAQTVAFSEMRAIAEDFHFMRFQGTPFYSHDFN
jgi:hypothetical protein